jgi:hypothetical protein
MKILNPISNQVVIETKNFKSDMETVKTFLRNHDVDLSSMSAYNADVSSGVSTADEERARLRQSKISLGSTIHRPSDASSISRPSVSSGN